MYKEETVFILGAGASWHYGYPTGEELIRLVKEAANRLRDICDHLRREPSFINIPPEYLRKDKNDQTSSALNKFIEECEWIKDTLNQVNPLVIDYFLHHHPSLQNIGKLLISFVLLERERDFIQHNGNINQIKKLENSPDRIEQNRAQHFDVSKCNDDWLRYVLSKLVRDCEKPCDLLKNKISFITFNYDVSLENRIFNDLVNNERIPKKDKHKFYNRDDLVLHVYGSLTQKAFENDQYGKFPIIKQRYGLNNPKLAIDTKVCLDKAWAAAQNIYTIPEQKKENNQTLDIAKDKISKAQTIYILGYGFDENNSDLIGLNQINPTLPERIKAKRKIYFTNYSDSNRINKAAGKLFLNNESTFIGTSLPNFNSLGDDHYEKSIKNVYDALAHDF